MMKKTENLSSKVKDKRLALLVPVTWGIAFFLGMESGGFQLVLLKMAEEFRLDPVMMGTVVTSQFAAIFLAPLLFGWITDRVSKKLMLLLSMLFFIAGCFAAAMSQTILLFSCAVFTIGIGFSMSESIGSSFLSDSFPGKENVYLNIMQSGFSMGAVISPLLFNSLIQAGLVSWRMVFIIAGGGFITFIPLLVIAKGSKPQETVCEQRAAEPQARSFISVILSPLFILLFFSMMIYVAIEMGIAFFADSLFVTEYGNTSLGAYAISGFWFSMAISRFVFSRIKIKPQTMVMTGFGIISLLLVFSLPFRNPYFFLVIIFLLGIGTGPIWPMIIGIGASIDQKRSGTNTSILYAAGGLGGAIIPVIIGFVAEWYSFYIGFWVLAFFSTLGFLIMWIGTRKKKNL